MNLFFAGPKGSLSCLETWWTILVPRVQPRRKSCNSKVSLNRIAAVETSLTLYDRRIYDNYSFQIIPVIGEIVAGDWKSYQYLVESIRKFPIQVFCFVRLASADLNRLEIFLFSRSKCQKLVD